MIMSYKRPRFRIGQQVRVTQIDQSRSDPRHTRYSARFVGKQGSVSIIPFRGQYQPYQVRFPDGDDEVFREGELEPVE